MNVVSATERIAEGRVASRQRRIRQALVDAGYRVISEKGVDAATMQEIADMADVGAGTIYSYFKSKDDLAVAVMEEVTNSFTDPAQVYAFGVRTVMEAATGDPRWKRLLNRSEVIADAMFRCMGPFAMRDLENATTAGRFRISNIELTWKWRPTRSLGPASPSRQAHSPPNPFRKSSFACFACPGCPSPRRRNSPAVHARPCRGNSV